jgi:hypothetical protein
MAQPDSRSLIVAGPLQNVSIRYHNKDYIGDRVFPVLDRVSTKAKIARYLKGAWFRDEADVRAPNTRAKRGGYPIDYIDIATKEYAFAKEVSDEDRRDAAEQNSPLLQPDIDALEFTADKIDLRKEILVATLVLASTWSGVAGEDADGKWAKGSGNTFLADVRARIETIRANTGLIPNVLEIDHGTYTSLKDEDTVLEKIKYTQLGVFTKELLASLLDLDEIIVGTAIKNTAKETKAGTAFTAANVWEKNAGKGSAFLYYRPRRPGLKTPSAGYQARTAFLGGQLRRSERWRENAEHQDVYETAENTHILQTGDDLGFLWYDTLLT